MILPYRRFMPARKRPTPEDTVTARQILLDGLPREVGPQPGQPRQKDGAGRVQAAHSGLVRVPPRINSTRPQPAQRARRFWQALHHGRPVARDISQGALRPQIDQVILAPRRPE
jgi:hypothetical protein